MVKTIEFGWYYVRHAWRGCSTCANELGALLGGALLALAIWLCSPYLREQDLIEAPTTYWGVAGLNVAMAICSVILSVSGYLYNATFASAGAPLLGAKTSGENRCRELRIALKQPDADDTKWTINDLFQHIDPDFLENNRWLKVGDELR